MSRIRQMYNNLQVLLPYMLTTCGSRIIQESMYGSPSITTLKESRVSNANRWYIGLLRGMGGDTST